MKKRLMHILSLLLLATLVLSACGSKAPVVAKPPLRVAWSLWPGYYPMAIAAEKGFFAKHGVEVEPVLYNVYSNQLPDLASGMVDGAAIILSDTLFDALSNSINVVMVLDHSAGADQVVAAPGINSPADLRGKRIGVQSTAVGGTLLIRRMLEQNNISISEVTLVSVAPEQVPQAIPSQIDAGYTYEPFSSQARAAGDKVIFSSADAPGVIVDVLTFRREVVQQRPEDVKAFIAAWQEALQYWKDNPAEGNAIIAKATGMQPEEISSEGVQLFDLAANRQAYTQGTDATSLYFTTQTELDFLINTGDITNPVKISELLNPSFLQ